MRLNTKKNSSVFVIATTPVKLQT